MGSNPIARSQIWIADCKGDLRNPFLTTASWPSGKARVCKTLIHGFKSRRRLYNLVQGTHVFEYLGLFAFRWPSAVLIERNLNPI